MSTCFVRHIAFVSMVVGACFWNVPLEPRRPTGSLLAVDYG